MPTGVKGARDAVVAGALDEVADTPDLLLGAAQRERDRRYTLHLDFAADDPASAQALAAAAAEALGILRLDVQTYSAAVSAGGRWGDAKPVFCMADGPEGAFCSYAVGHAGWHAEAGVDGLRWGDGDETGTSG